MKENIRFSVLMSVYNKEKADNLKVAIDSIVNQTLLPNEFIIVEDGPLTNELENVLNKYTREYDWIKTIKLSQNSGLGVALREGVKHCQYEYIARMDSDDYSLPTRFEKQISYLRNNFADVIGTNITEYSSDMNKIISKKNVPQNDNDIKKYLRKRNPFNHMSVIYNKNKVIEAGNYEDCPFFEDYYLWCKISKNKAIFYNIQESLVNVRGGKKMINRRGGLNYCKYIINFQNKILKLKIINFVEYLINIFVRCIVAVIPGKIREVFYSNLLRK